MKLHPTLKNEINVEIQFNIQTIMIINCFSNFSTKNKLLLKYEDSVLFSVLCNDIYRIVNCVSVVFGEQDKELQLTLILFITSNNDNLSIWPSKIQTYKICNSIKLNKSTYFANSHQTLTSLIINMTVGWIYLGFGLLFEQNRQLRLITLNSRKTVMKIVISCGSIVNYLLLS